MVRQEFDSNRPEASPETNQVQTDLNRWAAVVGSCETPFPVGLSSGDEMQLAEQVQKTRRRRLIRLLAKQIALHFFKAADGGADAEEQR